MFMESDHGKFVNIDVDNSSIDELYEKFQIVRGKSPHDNIKDLDMNLFKKMHQEVKQSEIKFYAFLNKEFNILNKKSLICAYNCYDDQSVSLSIK